SLLLNELCPEGVMRILLICTSLSNTFFLFFILFIQRAFLISELLGKCLLPGWDKIRLSRENTAEGLLILNF
ncbi:hypothetical protein ACQUW5_05760, partial [Legionella sp. CNM-1927-20]|uniref:hypothetical protein n=1 Tax=Legionella sp. CNM-1927-20 TaxID=3422221 RepID=UPI00403B10A1